MAVLGMIHRDLRPAESSYRGTSSLEASVLVASCTTALYPGASGVCLTVSSAEPTAAGIMA